MDYYSYDICNRHSFDAINVLSIIATTHMMKMSCQACQFAGCCLPACLPACIPMSFCRRLKRPIQAATDSQAPWCHAGLTRLNLFTRSAIRAILVAPGACLSHVEIGHSRMTTEGIILSHGFGQLDGRKRTVDTRMMGPHWGGQEG